MHSARLQNDESYDLPVVRGKYSFDYSLKKLNWFQVGGTCDILFKPEDTEDLAYFIKNKPQDLPVYILGAGSNMMVRDGGIPGCCIKLGRFFSQILIQDNEVIVGASCLDRTLVMTCAEHGLSGLEFLVGVPGSIGGAVAMNAGAYGYEIKSYLKWIKVVDIHGNITILEDAAQNMQYRKGNIAKGAIVVEACFVLQHEEKEIILKRVEEYLQQRNDSQPTKGKMGGSTFKNPASSPLRAWELIDQAGCRGLAINDAIMSEKHCNFMMNMGDASSEDLEKLGDEVIQRVKEKTGVDLEWEIIRIGLKKSS